MADRRAVPSLGEYIRRQREVSELSMRQFAQLVGISNPYLSQIERGLRAPSDQVVRSIAQALQVSADTLYEQAGVPRDPHLTGRQRTALIEAYEAFVAVGARPKRG
jgi:transcriptional regulator with XRE-family HTH domain